MKALTVSFPLKLFPGLREMGERVAVFVVAALADGAVEEGRLESPPAWPWLVAGTQSDLPTVK